MNNPTLTIPGMLSGLALTLAAAGCGVALEPDASPGQPEAPDLSPNLPDYQPGEDGQFRFRATQGILRGTSVRGTALGGNADGVNGCAFEYQHYEHGGEVDGTQLHVIGVYESMAENDFYEEEDPGPVEINVNRPGTSVLVLSAYDPVIWNIHVAPGSTLEGVVVSGYLDQVVNAPAGVPVAYYTHDIEKGTRPLVDGVAYFWPSYDATELVDVAEELTGLELSSFRGCYRSDRFDIDEPGELRPPHETSSKAGRYLPESCAALAEESNVCALKSGETMLFAGLDSQTLCESEVISDNDAFSRYPSLGWLGDYVYTCDERRSGLQRISLIDGSVDVAPIPCEGVAIHEGALLTLLHFPLEQDVVSFPPLYLARFATFEDAVAREVEQVFELAPAATFMGVSGNTAYFSWYSGRIEAAELSDGAVFKPLVLKDLEVTIHGMDVTDDGILVALGSSLEHEGLVLFDADTGSYLGEFDHPDGGLYADGIDCYSGSTLGE
ncbi:hypothetical protein [Haliangium ochraceum]|uniref:Lipoprotein n=1 Tax=Haliangium ochraceum (strain DSM 14365 / JCM 11303 / SMP-2) TaxID=502025 RepID=D0LSC1_HALO1|nr:hypothetical protein [Haliangium ochraceum]ACY15620.1 hypothetical protein Hoch_3118 [Haliangium ochraceum DSM 14365]